MNPQTIAEAKRLFNSVKKGLRGFKKAEAVVCPPFIYIPVLRAFTLTRFSASQAGLVLGAQDCFLEQKGAYTGEISPSMLKDTGCQYVIIGHSERRRYFKETDEMINKKLKAVLEKRLKPILCIGETKEERNDGKTENVLKKQIESDLKGISGFKLQVSGFCIAYEPVWAIGTGKPCDIEEAQKMGLLIRKIITKLYNSSTAEKVRILYGGSVNSRNAVGYIKESCFQGLLVGGASLEAKEFIKIIKAVC